MKRIIDRIFSDQYVNHGAVAKNVLLLVMYRFAYPFAVLLNTLHLSPNQITSSSLVFSIFSFIALVLDDGWVLFTAFWGVTVLLDFCDGTVARMSNRVSKSAFRYDHMSDLFKISLVILGTGLRYDNYHIWVLAFSACFLFMYGDTLNHVLEYTAKHPPKLQGTLSSQSVSCTPYVRFRDRYRIAAWLVKYRTLISIGENAYAALLSVNGHTLLLFLLFPLGEELASWGLAYLVFVLVWNIRSRMALLIPMRR